MTVGFRVINKIFTIQRDGLNRNNRAKMNVNLGNSKSG